MPEQEEIKLFKLFGCSNSNLDEYNEGCKEFNSLRDRISNFLKSNAKPIENSRPKLYNLNGSIISKEEFPNPQSMHSLRDIKCIELTLKGIKQDVEKAADFLRKRFNLDNPESLGIMWDSPVDYLFSSVGGDW